MAGPLIKLTTARTVGDATLVRDSLRAAGIESEIRGEHRPSIAGELPFAEAEVEIWVPPADEDKARAMLRVRPVVDPTKSRRCGKCGERSPLNFDVCWSCEGPLSDSTEDAAPEEARPASKRAILTAGLVLGLFAAGIGYVAGTRAPYQDDPAIFSRFNFDKTCFENVHRVSGTKISESCDVDRDGVYEVTRSYANGGWLLSELFDADRSGLGERMVSYAQTGARQSESIDADENGVFEKLTNFAADGQAVVNQNVDADQNGIFERWIETRGDGLRIVWHDVDQNHVFEQREIYRGDALLLTEVDQGEHGFSGTAAK